MEILRRGDPWPVRKAKLMYWLSGKLTHVRVYQHSYTWAQDEDGDRFFRKNPRCWTRANPWATGMLMRALNVRGGHSEHWAYVHADDEGSCGRHLPCTTCGGRVCMRMIEDRR